MNIQSELNEMQLKAVETNSQYVRIIAGAGSGKTRVLTYRIAFLISECNVPPWSILAITFTNKVANEMRQRVIKMLPEINSDLTIKTFHSFAAQFLRREIGILGFPSTFSILDEEDQTKLIKDIVANMGFKRGDKIVGRAIGYISKNKIREKRIGNRDSLTLVLKFFNMGRPFHNFFKQSKIINYNSITFYYDSIIL